MKITLYLRISFQTLQMKNAAKETALNGEWLSNLLTNSVGDEQRIVLTWAFGLPTIYVISIF